LNPAREQNQLPIIEDYILLKQYDNAQAWIHDHKKEIADQDVRVMFSFFDLVCMILKQEEHTARSKEFQLELVKAPLSKQFVEKFWKPEFLISFLNDNPFPQASKTEVTNLIQALQETAR